jgi:WD40 repeat protein/serine/threonine protein kinase
LKNLDAIYFAARELPSADRPDFLAQACAGDDELQRRVKEMLAVSAEAEAFITDLPDDDSEDRTSDNGSAKHLKLDVEVAPDEAVGQMIGRYKILERVGEGGCGVVYVAEQTEPVRRRVALKVIKLGMDTKQVVARFEAERQALAMMDHPNIAKVLDAGTTDVGRLYFVMELVRGIRITDHCDQANLTTKERLDLFIKVCQAIQHAHQKGIIHRDIKPSNILVTLHDGVPVPKVIDFGIAKATEGRLTDATVYTQLHQFIGTPAYMSPEQAEMSGLDIDTRSDIYSLGVLLYELLAGSTPFDAKELMASGIDAMRKTIREKEPMRPSTKLSQTLVAADVRRLKTPASDTTSSEEEVRASSRRLLRVKETITLLQGDLDWIVMKALEKDRTRRYETANGLAADIQRHLKNEPVVARPPSTAYRIQKAWQRNKLAFTAATAVAVALVVGISISVWQAAVAIRATQIAKQERDAAKAATLRADEQAESNRRNLYAADMLAAQIALRQLNSGATRQLLDRHVPGANRQDLRGFEWRLLWQQSRGDQLRTLQAHSDVVVCVAFSPDGKYLLSGSRDGSVVVWDVSSGRKLNSWLAHKSGVNSVSFSPDGKLVATGGGYRGGALGPELVDASVKLWEWPEITLQTTFTNLGGHAEFDRVNMRLFTGFGPDHKGGGASNRVALLNLISSTGPERVVQFQTARCAFAAASPHGDLVAVGSLFADVQLRDLDGRLLRSLDESKGALSLAFSPKADLLAVCSGDHGSRPENEIRVHDMATGRRLVSLTNHTSRVWSLAFSPDGRWLASASSDQTVRLWDAATWREANRFPGHGSEVRTVAFSPDGKLVASGGKDATVRLWNVTPERTSEEIKGARVNYGWGNLAEFMGGGELFAASSGDHISVWNVTTGHVEHEFAPGRWFLGEDSSGESILTLVPRAGIAVLQFWDRHDFRLKKELRVQADVGGLKDVSLSFNRKSLLLRLPGGVVQVDCANGSILRQILLPGKTGFTVRLSSDETAWAGFVPGWNLAGVGPTERSHAPTALEGHRREINGLAFSPTQGLLATASTDGTARLWEVPSGRPAAVLAGHKETVFDCAFSPDGRTLATASGDRTVKLWHVHTQRDMLTLTHDSPVTSVAFSREGNYLATGTVDGTYHFWRAASWEEIKTTGAPVRSDYERATLREGKISTVSDTNDDATQATKWQRRLDDYASQKKQAAGNSQTNQAASALPEHPLALKDWFRRGTRPNDYTTGLDDSTTLDGQTVAFIKSKEPQIDGYGTYMQMFQAKDFLGKGIRLSARIKTESTEGGAVLWMRVDGPNREMFVLDNMHRRPIKGTRDWAQYEIVLYVSNRAKAIGAGLMVYGTGQAWISDVKFTVVPEAQLNTELLKDTGAPPF